jgi:MFS transporter, Spinster family, sphingosine-1-phosphate transporter
MALAPIDTKGSEEPEILNDPYKNKIAKQWWLVFVLTLAATLGAIDRQIMQLLLVPIKTDLGLTDTQISLLYGLAFSLANVMFLLPAGYFADRVNRRTLLLAGVAVWSVMTAACGFATNYFAMFLARSGVGFGESVIQPTGVSMLRSAVPHQRRGRAFAVYAMAIMLGTALALLIGGALLHAFEDGALEGVPVLGALKPWQSVLILLGLLGGPLLLLVSFTQEPGRPAPSSQVTPSYRQTLSYLHANRDIFYPLLTFNTAAGMLGLGFGAWVVPMLLRVWGLTIPQVGMTLGLMMLTLPPIGLIIVGWLLDRSAKRWQARGPLYVGLGAIVLIALVTSLAPIWPNLSGVWFLLGGVMLTSGACLPITNTVIASIAPPENLGRITGIQYIIYGIFAGAISATLIAVISDGFFPGETGIAKALSLMCVVYGSISFIAAAITIRNLRARADGQRSEA